MKGSSTSSDYGSGRTVRGRGGKVSPKSGGGEEGPYTLYRILTRRRDSGITFTHTEKKKKRMGGYNFLLSGADALDPNVGKDLWVGIGG